MQFKDFIKMIPGVSVTQRIKQVKQPKGGYINPKSMEITVLGEGIEGLNPNENISPGLVGTTVDYLTRFMSGASALEAFKISILGAQLVNEKDNALKMASMIVGLDDSSIIYASRLAGYDVIFRAGIAYYKDVSEINPNADTIENIRTMVKRALNFFNLYGKKTVDGFTFEGGYTKTVSSGDGDFLTSNTLWDFKVSKTPPKKEHTLQLLMYWRMGLHSIHPEFKDIKYLGIYNPRLNTVYRITVDSISKEVIEEAEKDIIGYD